MADVKCEGSSSVAIDVRVRSENQTVMPTPTARTSMPNAVWDWSGASPSRDSTSTVTSIDTVTSPRSGRPGYLRMRSRLIDTATNTSPASAADAPAAATNRSDHGSMAYAGSGTARAYRRASAEPGAPSLDVDAPIREPVAHCLGRVAAPLGACGQAHHVVRVAVQLVAPVREVEHDRRRHRRGGILDLAVDA